MAESKTKRKSSKTKSRKSSSRKSSGGSSRTRQSSAGSSRSRQRNGRSSGEDRSPREIVIEAVKQMQDLIGRPIESVTGIEKNGSEWTVTVEVLELERVPNTTDVLGKYELTVDKNGELTGAHRTRRYHRAEAGED